jgi:hypothetical protein
MSNDAEPPAADGEAMPPHGHPYTHALRLHRGGRGFVALCRKPGTNGRAMDTRCYDGGELFMHLPPTSAEGEHFISVNTFKSPRRTIANLLSLRACFSDLDFYALSVWSGATEEAVWVEVQVALAAAAMPHPTMVVASGRGLQLSWSFPKGLPREVLPRWVAVQQHIYDLLKPFGADPRARDAARILRLAGTHNAKAGKVARFLHLEFDRDVDFEDLHRAVLPFSQRELQELRRQRAERKAEAGTVDPGRSSRARDAHRAFVDTIIADIDRLVDWRWGGRIPEGHRNTTLFVRGCFLVRVVGTVKLEGALLAYGVSRCDLGTDEMLQIVGSIVKQIVEDGRGYRYSTVGAAEALGVTVAEVRAAGLRRLHPADPGLAEERRQARLKRDRERKAEARREARAAVGSKPRRGKPWLDLGIPRATWYRKYYFKHK